MIRLAFVFLAFAVPAAAHMAASGWNYPALCCGGEDCRSLAPDEYEMVAEGYRIIGTGEVIPQEKARRDGPDGAVHQCTSEGMTRWINGRPCFWAPMLGAWAN